GVGTGGTISGTARYLKERNPDIRVIGADPEGSIYTQPDNMHTYKVEGVGEDFWPGTIDPSLIDQWIKVTDRDSFSVARRLTREEGILVGGSCGLAAWAALEVAKEVDDPAALVVVLLPDSGRGYLSKIYNDDWMRENGFLSRLGQPIRVGAVLAERRGETPKVVAIGRDQTVAEAIELLREHDISQLPVLRDSTYTVIENGGRIPIEVQSVVGSLQERSLLDALFRKPDVLSAKVSTIMEGPFPLVDANEEVERVVPMLATGSPAVLVQRGGLLVGVVTRADVLEYVAHHRAVSE
ncbi:MAG: pyridoxal-phosphate dependent enzyme, partial [Thermomicrobiales bacterium]